MDERIGTVSMAHAYRLKALGGVHKDLAAQQISAGRQEERAVNEPPLHALVKEAASFAFKVDDPDAFLTPELVEDAEAACQPPEGRAFEEAMRIYEEAVDESASNGDGLEAGGSIDDAVSSLCLITGLNELVECAMDKRPIYIGLSCCDDVKIVERIDMAFRARHGEAAISIEESDNAVCMNIISKKLQEMIVQRMLTEGRIGIVDERSAIDAFESLKASDTLAELWESCFATIFCCSESWASQAGVRKDGSIVYVARRSNSSASLYEQPYAFFISPDHEKEFGSITASCIDLFRSLSSPVTTAADFIGAFMHKAKKLRMPFACAKTYENDPIIESCFACSHDGTVAIVGVDGFPFINAARMIEHRTSSMSLLVPRSSIEHLAAMAKKAAMEDPSLILGRNLPSIVVPCALEIDGDVVYVGSHKARLSSFSPVFADVWNSEPDVHGAALRLLHDPEAACIAASSRRR